MKPLIPKARIGDLLKGTRNLRHYLHTASTLNYLNAIAECESGKRAKEAISLCKPSKEDRYLVVANANNVFAAYCLDHPVVLAFYNGSPSSPPPRPLMNPTIFSQWFIRTPERLTNLKDWTNLAHYLWVALHLNLTNSKNSSAIRVHLFSNSTGPFRYKEQLPGVNRADLEKLVRTLAPYGVTRGTYLDQKSPHNGLGAGPRLEDIPHWKEEIRFLCENPRVARHLKSKAKESHQGLMKN